MLAYIYILFFFFFFGFLHTDVGDDPDYDTGGAGNLVSGTCFETVHSAPKVTIDTKNYLS